jgi:hypothetical protein
MVCLHLLYCFPASSCLDTQHVLGAFQRVRSIRLSVILQAWGMAELHQVAAGQNLPRPQGDLTAGLRLADAKLWIFAKEGRTQAQRCGTRWQPVLSG